MRGTLRGCVGSRPNTPKQESWSVSRGLGRICFCIDCRKARPHASASLTIHESAPSESPHSR